MRQSLFVIDGLNQIFRAYYAPFRPLTSPSGEPTKATYVFLRMFLQFVREWSPDYLAVALEGGESGSDFRRNIYPDYKANRSSQPDDFRPQVDRIKSLLGAMGVPILQSPGFEADDVMATVAKVTEGRDRLDVFLVSSDKDLRQLIAGERVSLLNPKTGIVLDAYGLADEHGYTPAEAVEIQTLTGDPTDNVPGARGVGEKTAVKLIKKYGTAEATVAHAEELTPKQRENILAFADKMPTTRRLVTLRTDVPLDFDLDKCAADFNIDAVKPMFEELGFRSLVKDLEKLARIRP